MLAALLIVYIFK